MLNAGAKVGFLLERSNGSAISNWFASLSAVQERFEQNLNNSPQIAGAVTTVGSETSFATAQIYTAVPMAEGDLQSLVVNAASAAGFPTYDAVVTMTVLDSNPSGEVPTKFTLIRGGTDNIDNSHGENVFFGGLSGTTLEYILIGLGAFLLIRLIKD